MDVIKNHEHGIRVHAMHRVETTRNQTKESSTHRPPGLLRHKLAEPLPNGKAYVMISQPLAWRPQNCPTHYFINRVIGTMCERVVPQRIHAYGFPLCHLRLCEHEDVEQERQKRKGNK